MFAMLGTYDKHEDHFNVEDVKAVKVFIDLFDQSTDSDTQQHMLPQLENLYFSQELEKSRRRTFMYDRLLRHWTSLHINAEDWGSYGGDLEDTVMLQEQYKERFPFKRMCSWYGTRIDREDEDEDEEEEEERRYNT